MKKQMSMNLKLVLSNLAYVVPVAVLVYLLAGVRQTTIDFASFEQVGNIYQRALEKELSIVGQHSWLAQRALHGDGEAKSKLKSVSANLEQGIEILEKMHNEYGSALQFTDTGLALRQREHLKLETFRKEWEALKEQQDSMAPEVSVEKHAHLIADLRGMITHLGDTSNLILDPDLDSYYLMDVTLVALPQMQERLVDILTRGEGIVRRQALSVEDRKWLTIATAMLKQADYDRIAGDVQTSLNEDKNFNGMSSGLQANILPAVQDNRKNLDQLLKLMDDLLVPENAVTLEQFLSAAEGSYFSSFGLWDVSSKELHQLLQTRIENERSARNLSILYSVLVMIAAAIFSTLLGMSIRTGIIQSVSSAVETMRGIAQVVAESNRQLVQASESLASGTSQQASAIQETVSTLDEISSMTEKSASGAQNSASEARDSQNAAAESKQSLQDLVRALSEINESSTTMISQVTESNQRIVEIVSMIQEIGNKTKVINDIVFQTKLLSFNASVEAARAGEHGKGFAVVAEEVGNLAEMSGTAAKEITTLLEQSTAKVNGIVDETKRNLDSVVKGSKDKMAKGMEIAGRCEETLNTAVTKVETVTQLMSEIASATKEQALGVSEIGKAMNLLDQATQTNSSTAEQAAELARELDQQAQGLRSSIEDLESKIGRKAEAGAVSPAGAVAPVIPLKTRGASEISESKHSVQPVKKVASGEFTEVPDASNPGFIEE